MVQPRHAGVGLLLAGMQQAAAAASARFAPEPLAFATDLLADAAQSAKRVDLIRSTTNDGAWSIRGLSEPSTVMQRGLTGLCAGLMSLKSAKP